MIDNPNYQRIIDSHVHLEGVQMTENDPEPHQPVHLILGASKYVAIKTSERALVGLLCHLQMESDHNNMLLTQTSHVDYTELC